ncbi:hypothetical protein C8J56DRAFT_785076 [Mycena floridula]|nr:hypothetical protein C8J56DRAFT_785076 [Mycena floridula]
MNINGAKGSSINVETHKWREVRGLTFQNKLGRLVIQEHKMMDEQIGKIEESVYGQDLEIFMTSGENPRSGGVAVVFNRKFTNVEGIKSYEIIPGKALCIVHPWHGAETEVILAIYAPTKKPANSQFYDELVNIWTHYKLPTPTKVIGDTNITIDMLDRLSHKLEECESSRAAHIRFTKAFSLEDGWRDNYPDAKEYTYSWVNENGEAGQSRLDRIYTSSQTHKLCQNWKIQDWAGHLTDHRIVTVEIRVPGTPFQGKGRYSMQLPSIHDNKFMEKCEKIGSALQE